MQSHKGSVLIPLLILMTICAGCTAYVTHLISVNSKQALGLRNYLASRSSADNYLHYISNLLRESGHDASALPEHVAAFISDQQTMTINQASVLLTSVTVSPPDSQLSRVAARYVRYPWIKQLPSEALVSPYPLTAAINSSAYSQSMGALATATYPEQLRDWLFSAPDAINALPQAITDCSVLDAFSQGAFIINSECAISEQQVVGSPAEPVLLIVRQSNFSMQQNSQLWGLVFQTASSKNDMTRIDMSVTAIINGAVLVDHKLVPGSSLHINFEPAVLASLRAQPSLQLHHIVPGSWRDFE